MINSPFLGHNEQQLSPDLDKDHKGHEPHHHSAHTAGSHPARATFEIRQSCFRRRPPTRGEHAGRQGCSARRALRHRSLGGGGGGRGGGDGRDRSGAAGRKDNVGGSGGALGGCLRGELNLRHGDLGGEERDRGRRGDRLARRDPGGEGAGHGHRLNDGDGRDWWRCRQRRIAWVAHQGPGRARYRSQGDGFRNAGDDPRVFKGMGGANAGQVGEGGLNIIRIIRPAGDAVLDVLGETGILAIAIAVCIVGALGQGEPGIQAFRQNGWRWDWHDGHGGSRGRWLPNNTRR